MRWAAVSTSSCRLQPAQGSSPRASGGLDRRRLKDRPRLREGLGARVAEGAAVAARRLCLANTWCLRFRNGKEPLPKLKRARAAWELGDGNWEFRA
jgi:hypothetical protein